VQKVAGKSIVQDKMADDSGTDETMDEAVELVEERNAFSRPTDSIAKPRRGVLWGAL
jgi:hypothetical protein